MHILIPFIFLFLLFIIELIYFKIADKYNIIDHPNHRSSHTKVTIRGGGIVFTTAFIIASFYLGWGYRYFMSGLILISIISFVDDINSTSRRVRFLCHIASVALMFYQLSIYALPIYWIVLGFIFAIGTINAINFMDGINGITGGYSLVTLATLYYIDANIISFTDKNYLMTGILCLLVFNFFNFRTKAQCFAGDVGSVSIAFIMLFFILQLIVKTGNLSYVLLLLVYGLDASTTIFFRSIRGENVFEAHRSHFYQFLVNEKKVPQLVVTGLYMLVQLVINIFLLNVLYFSILNLILIAFLSALTFIAVRLKIEGKGLTLKKK